MTINHTVYSELRSSLLMFKGSSHHDNLIQISCASDQYLASRRQLYISTVRANGKRLTPEVVHLGAASTEPNISN